MGICVWMENLNTREMQESCVGFFRLVYSAWWVEEEGGRSEVG